MRARSCAECDGRACGDKGACDSANRRLVGTLRREAVAGGGHNKTPRQGLTGCIELGDLSSMARRRRRSKRNGLAVQFGGERVTVGS